MKVFAGEEALDAFGVAVDGVDAPAALEEVGAVASLATSQIDCEWVRCVIFIIGKEFEGLEKCFAGGAACGDGEVLRPLTSRCVDEGRLEIVIWCWIGHIVG